MVGQVEMDQCRQTLTALATHAVAANREADLQISGPKFVSDLAILKLRCPVICVNSSLNYPILSYPVSQYNVNVHSGQISQGQLVVGHIIAIVYFRRECVFSHIN